MTREVLASCRVTFTSQARARRPFRAVGQHDRWYSDAEVAAFAAAGGARAARARIRRVANDGTPDFSPPDALYETVRAPAR